MEIINTTLTDEEEDRLSVLEEQIERAQEEFSFKVMGALTEINQRTLYRKTHTTFETYVRDRFSMSRDYAYKLIRAGKVVKNITSVDHGLQFSNDGPVLPTSERQIRSLSQFAPEEQVDIWNKAVEVEDGGVPSAKVVSQVADDYKNGGSEVGDERGEMSQARRYAGDYGNPVSTDEDEDNMQDFCQTPPYAVLALRRYLPENIQIVWEPAAGDGYMARSIREGYGFDVVETCLTTGQNYFETSPPDNYDMQITNCPWSKKIEWYVKAISEGRPFAVLSPSAVTPTVKFSDLFLTNPELAIVNIIPRIDYYMPIKKDWLASSSPKFSCWITYKLDIPNRFTYADVRAEKKAFIERVKRGEWV